MKSTVLGYEKAGDCDFSGKKGTEVFVVQVGDGEPRRVATGRLIEILKWNAEIPESGSLMGVSRPESERSDPSGIRSKTDK